MKDNEHVVTVKQVKDAARLLLSQRGGIIPGADKGIKALVGLLVVSSKLVSSETNS